MRVVCVRPRRNISFGGRAPEQCCGKGKGCIIECEQFMPLRYRGCRMIPSLKLHECPWGGAPERLPKFQR
eukprot:5025365-Prymnesium_polylepis.1